MNSRFKHFHRLKYAMHMTFSVRLKWSARCSNVAIHSHHIDLSHGRNQSGRVAFMAYHACRMVSNSFCFWVKTNASSFHWFGLVFILIIIIFFIFEANFTHHIYMLTWNASICFIFNKICLTATKNNQITTLLNALRENVLL